jgi:hypothetical protein
MSAITRFAAVLASCAALALAGAAYAQTDPVFTLRLDAATAALPTTPAAGKQTVRLFVDADRDVPDGKTYTLTVNLCPGAPVACTGASTGNWYFFGYPEIGQTCCAPQDQTTDLSPKRSFQFNFQKGKNTGAAPNPRAMGLGQVDVPNLPTFVGFHTVAFSLTGAQASTTNPYASLTITGITNVPGIDLDINGNPIPDPTGTTAGCEFPGNSPSPGTGPGPCGSYEVKVKSTSDPPIDCSNEMNGGSEITNAWQYNLAYNYGAINSLRLGMQPRHALSFRFKTPTVEEAVAAGQGAGWFPHSGGVLTTEQVNRGGIPGMHVSISEKRCDFRRSAFTSAGYDPCHQTSNNATLSFSYKLLGNTTDPDLPATCTLRPGKYYYVNIRFENVLQTPGSTACIPGAGYTTCGFTFQLN